MNRNPSFEALDSKMEIYNRVEPTEDFTQRPYFRTMPKQSYKSAMKKLVEPNYAYKSKPLADKIGQESHPEVHFRDSQREAYYQQPYQRLQERTSSGSKSRQGHSFLNEDLSQLVEKEAKKKEYANTLREQMRRRDEQKKLDAAREQRFREEELAFVDVGKSRLSQASRIGGGGEPIRDRQGNMLETKTGFSSDPYKADAIQTRVSSQAQFRQVEQPTKFSENDYYYTPQPKPSKAQDLKELYSYIEQQREPVHTFEPREHITRS